MIRIDTWNKQVALAPFVKENAQEKTKAKGLDFTDTTVTKLIKSTVLFGGHDFVAGDVLYFRAEVLKLPYANQKLQLGEETFILMPVELVVLRESIQRE